MKNLMPVGALLCFLINVSHLPAAEKWEGTDSFDNTLNWWKKIHDPSRDVNGQFLNLSGQIVYQSTVPDDDNAAWWAWGSAKKYISVPTSQCWEIRCDGIFPKNSPVQNLYDAGIGLALYAPADKGSYRAVWARLHAVYIYGVLVPNPLAESDFNFEARKGSDGGGPAEVIDNTAGVAGQFTLVYRHNALDRTDTFRVEDAASGSLLYTRTGATTLTQAKTCAVGPWMSIDSQAIWPVGPGYLTMDNWSLLSYNPDPINLNAKNGTSKGISYSVTVTNLGMTGAKLNGTVALTVGSASATLPITGSIDKNGYFALTAKGTGANKGYGCVLLYDVATGTYRPNKNTVTAPKQKAIKF